MDPFSRDWKKINKYSKDLSRGQLAWEYLRRWEAYATEFTLYVNYPSLGNGTSQVTVADDVVLGDYYTTEPEFPSTKTYGEFKDFCLRNTDEPIIASMMAVADTKIERYQILDWVSPLSDKPAEFVVTFDYPIVTTPTDHMRHREREQGEVHVVFNCELELAPQIAKAVEQLKIEAKKVNNIIHRINPRVHVEYLRILDALCLGDTLSNDDIARELYPTDDAYSRKQKLDKAKARAIFLRDGGYLELLNTARLIET